MVFFVATIADPRVTVLTIGKQILPKIATGTSYEQPRRVDKLHLAVTPIVAPSLIAVTDTARKKNILASVANARNTQIWYTVWRNKPTVTTPSGKSLERTNDAKYPKLVKNHSHSDHRRPFSREAKVGWEKCWVAADIGLEVNKTLYTNRIRTHIRILWLNYKKKGNLSWLMGATAISSIILL